MELVEVEVIGFQALQRRFQLLPRPFGVAAFALAGKEHALAVRGQRRAEFLLRLAIAIGRSDIKIVHSSRHCLGHDVVGVPLFQPHDDDPAKADQRQADLLVVGPFGDRFRRIEAGQRQTRGRARDEKLASVHSHVSILSQHATEWNHSPANGVAVCPRFGVEP